VDTADYFAVAAPGLEHMVAGELAALGIGGAIDEGGVAWSGVARSMMEANLHLRTASRVLARADTFSSRTFHELERRARRVPWDRFVARNTSVGLRVTCRKSRLYHEDAVAERIMDAIAESTGIAGPPVSDDADSPRTQMFVIRMFRDQCTISADTSGARLHQRGYRLAQAKAPLRETIAAAMLIASGWDRRSALVDPLCGSGTIPIEAALLARRIAPGIASAERAPRDFAFTRWPAFDDASWRELVDRARSDVLDTSPASIMASDRSAGAIRATRENAGRAGVADDIDLTVKPLSAIEPMAGPGWIVTNPPYGVRVGVKADASRMTHELEDVALRKRKGWTVCYLMPGTDNTRTRAGQRSLLSTRNGGIPVRLVLAGGEIEP
jgi:putative N6-adenine-specific DNA methylase